MIAVDTLLKFAKRTGRNVGHLPLMINIIIQRSTYAHFLHYKLLNSDGGVAKTVCEKLILKALQMKSKQFLIVVIMELNPIALVLTCHPKIRQLYCYRIFNKF